MQKLLFVHNLPVLLCFDSRWGRGGEWRRRCLCQEWSWGHILPCTPKLPSLPPSSHWLEKPKTTNRGGKPRQETRERQLRLVRHLHNARLWTSDPWQNKNTAWVARGCGAAGWPCQSPLPPLFPPPQQGTKEGGDRGVNKARQSWRPKPLPCFIDWFHLLAAS